MAVLRPNLLGSEIKGSVGGITYQISKWGQIAKLRSSTPPVVSAALAAQNDLAAFCVGVWRSLSIAQRDAWEAAAPSFPFTDKFGNPVVGSGYNLFMSVVLRTTPAWARTVSAAPVFTGGLGTWVMNDATVSGNLRFQFERSSGSVATTVTVYASPCLPVTVNNPRGNFRKIRQDFNITATVTTSLTSSYTSVFGPVENGSRIFFRAEFNNSKSPQMLGISNLFLSPSGF